MAEPYVLRALEARQQAEWDAFIDASGNGHLLQSWSWGDLKAGANWYPLRLALREEQTGKIVAAAQVLRRTAAHFPPYLAHLAYVPKGPVVDWIATTASGESLALLFLRKLRAHMRRCGALALQLEPNLEAGTEQAQAALQSLKKLGLHEIAPVQPLRTIALDVRPGEEVLLAQMKEKWRYNLRLAARKGVEVRPARNLEELQAWYSLLQTTGERDQFGIHTFDYYHRAWETMVARQQACLLLAYAGPELLAGIFVSRMAGEAIYLYGASSNLQRNLMPNYLLQWEAIRWARQTGVSSYDFWGIPASDEENEAMAGVYRFKSGWGGRIIRFVGNYEYVYHPLAMRVARTLLKA